MRKDNATHESRLRAYLCAVLCCTAIIYPPQREIIHVPHNHSFHGVVFFFFFPQFHSGKTSIQSPNQQEENTEALVKELFTLLTPGQHDLHPWTTSKKNSPSKSFALAIHGDICPDNAIYSRSTTAAGHRDRVVLVDFSSGAWGLSSALDAVFLSMFWPTCWAAGRIPEGVAAKVIAKYDHIMSASPCAARPEETCAAALYYALSHLYQAHHRPPLGEPCTNRTSLNCAQHLLPRLRAAIKICAPVVSNPGSQGSDGNEGVSIGGPSLKEEENSSEARKQQSRIRNHLAQVVTLLNVAQEWLVKDWLGRDQEDLVLSPIVMPMFPTFLQTPGAEKGNSSH